MKKIDPAVLAEVTQRLIAALQPKTIYLYGSHAYGKTHEDSDVDLLIITAESPLPAHRRAIPAYRALRGLFFPAEIKVVTQEEFAERSQWISSIERVAKEKGQVLYEYQA